MMYPPRKIKEALISCSVYWEKENDSFGTWDTEICGLHWKYFER
jgi:hypothetical protein